MTDIQLRSRSNHLTSGTAYQCVFGDYVVSWRADKKITMAVEPMHPIYVRYIVTNTFGGFPQDQYVGYKQVTRTIGGNKVLVEGFINTNGDRITWVKDMEFTFDGSNVKCTASGINEEYRQKCINQGDKVANDLTKACLWLNPSKRCWLRLNESTGWNLKWYSVREINPA
jgi:hypothetical protein